MTLKRLSLNPLSLRTPRFSLMAPLYCQKGQPHSSKMATLFVKNASPFTVKNGLFAVIAGLTRNLLLKAAMSNNRLSPGRLMPANQSEENVC